MASHHILQTLQLTIVALADHHVFVGHPAHVEPHAAQDRTHESILGFNIVCVLHDTVSRKARDSYHSV